MDRKVVSITLWGNGAEKGKWMEWYDDIKEIMNSLGYKQSRYLRQWGIRFLHGIKYLSAFAVMYKVWQQLEQKGVEIPEAPVVYAVVGTSKDCLPREQQEANAEYIFLQGR